MTRALYAAVCALAACITWSLMGMALADQPPEPPAAVGLVTVTTVDPYPTTIPPHEQEEWKTWIRSQRATTTTTTTTTPPPTSTSTTTTTPAPTTTTRPWVHPCDLIPQPGPGPVKLTQATMSHCREISPWFDPWDLVKALVVVECESNGDPYLNDRSYGHRQQRPMGIWSHMSHYWDGRSTKALGYVGDPYNTTEASRVASWLVYHDRMGWKHWDACLKQRAVRDTIANLKEMGL